MIFPDIVRQSSYRSFPYHIGRFGEGGPFCFTCQGHPIRDGMPLYGSEGEAIANLEEFIDSEFPWGVTDLDEIDTEEL